MKLIFKKTTHTHLLTLLLILLSLTVTIGGWFFTKHFLNYKEAQLLLRSGKLQVAESGFSLRRQTDTSSDTSKEADLMQDSGAFEGALISEDLTAQILRSWRSGASLISHDPKKGEMNMEQAITAGIGWIHNMAKQGFLPRSFSKNSFRDVSAILYTLEGKPDIPDYLLSRWIISYTIKEVQITLYIHAATGQVWQAEILAENDKLPEQLSSEEEALLKAAFPFLAGGGCEFSQNLQDESYRILVSSPEDKIVANVQWTMFENDHQDYTIAVLTLNSRL